jgi:cation-transporting ATPase 13A2
MNYRKAQSILRENVENDLSFLGLLIMENRLKPESTDVIKNLNSCNVRTVMATGDNILTAISVAR